MVAIVSGCSIAFHPKVLLLNTGLHDVGKKIAIDTYVSNLTSIVEIASPRSFGGVQFSVNLIEARRAG